MEQKEEIVVLNLTSVGRVLMEAEQAAHIAALIATCRAVDYESAYDRHAHEEVRQWHFENPAEVSIQALPPSIALTEKDAREFVEHRLQASREAAEAEAAREAAPENGAREILIKG